jgi:hypothetical protein
MPQPLELKYAIFRVMKQTKSTCLILGVLSAATVCLPGDAFCLNAFDMRVLQWTDECRNRSMDCFMTDVSEAWNPENLLLASMPVILYGDEKAFLCLELACKSLLISETTTAALKAATNRQRPDGEPHSRANSSFPSSHASSSFAVAYSISRYYPKWSIPAYGMAALISYSRVYLDAHHASDVIAGAGIGVLGGYLAGRYLQRWHFDRQSFVSKLPVRIAVGEGLGSVRVCISRRL